MTPLEPTPPGSGGPDPFGDLLALERDRILGVFDEALSALHAAHCGDHRQLRLITARSCDPPLLAHTVALMGAYGIGKLRHPEAVLAVLANLIDDSERTDP